MSGPYQGRDLSNCGVGRLRVAINCGVLSVNHHCVDFSIIINFSQILGGGGETGPWGGEIPVSPPLYETLYIIYKQGFYKP